MTRKSLVGALFIVAFLLALAPCRADNQTALNRQVHRIEQYVYGHIQEGEISERVSRIHKDLLGRDSPKNPQDKTDNLYSFLFKGSETVPSLDLKLNYLEWKIFHENRRGKLDDRLTSLEKLSFGKPSTEPLAFRMEQLIQMNIETGIIALHRVKLPKGTEFRVKLGKSLTTKHTKAGEEFTVTLSDDTIFEKNLLIVAKGGFAFGEVDQSKPAGRFGRSGRLRLTINEVAALDGTQIPVKVEGLADAFDKKKLGLAVGASAVGYVALGGPVGLVGGIFVKGREAEIPAGTEFVVTSIEDTYVNGVVIHRR